MSTSGSFVPASVPECAYAPRMTRAAAMALAAGGGLKENCVVVLITDTPVIGTAGNTSVTEIELNPVSPTAFGQTARVFTSFAPDAWPGVYDITNNAITELRDDWGNVVKDVDPTAPTVHGQFPWHLGGTSLRDNYVEDSTLTGWDTQVGFIGNNRAVNSTINLTGKTAGSLQDNVWQSAGLVLGAGGASASMSRSQIIGQVPGTVLINHTGTGALTYTEAIQRDAFLVTHSAVGALNVTNTVLENHVNAVPSDLNHASTGASTISIADSTIVGTTGTPVIENLGATGSISIVRSEINGGHLIKAAGSAGALTVNQSMFTDSTVAIGPANSATTNVFANAAVNQSTFNLQGPAAPGRNDFDVFPYFSGTTVTVAATATAGLHCQGGRFDNVSGINQNRTAGTNSTNLFSCDFRGFTTFTDNGTVDPGVGTSFNRMRLVDSAVTVGNVTGKTGSGTIAQQCELVGSTMTLTGPNGLAFLNRVRLWGGTLINAGFDGSDLIIDGGGVGATKTMTATQSNRLFNQSFDNWI